MMFFVFKLGLHYDAQTEICALYFLFYNQNKYLFVFDPMDESNRPLNCKLSQLFLVYVGCLKWKLMSACLET